MIFSLKAAALERDKRKFVAELRDYYVDKIRQESGWSIVGAISQRLRKREFSNKEARQLVRFLARNYDIRQTSLQYSTSFSAAGLKRESVSEKQHPGKENSGEFHELFMRLQAGVQDKLLSYRDACLLIEESTAGYPLAQEWIT